MMDTWIIVTIWILVTFFCILPVVIDLFANRLEAIRFILLLTVIKIVGFFRGDWKETKAYYYEQPYTRDPCPFEKRENVVYDGKDHLRVACWINKAYPVECTYNHQLCMRAKAPLPSIVVKK